MQAELFDTVETKVCRACDRRMGTALFYVSGDCPSRSSGVCRACFKAGAHVTCANCGERFNTYGRTAKAEVCSHRCYVERLRGGLPLVNDDGTKTCTKCGEPKPIDAFVTKRGKPEASCRECWNQDCNERYYQNRERYLARERERRANMSPEERERVSMRRRAYYERNRRRILAYQRRYRASAEGRATIRARAHEYHRTEAYRERDRARRMRHHERRKAMKRAYYRRLTRDGLPAWFKRRMNAHTRKRRARLANAEGEHTGADVVRLWHRQRGECVRCGGRFGKRPDDGGYHVDHVTPLSRGGSNWPRNLQLLCPTCNVQKNDKTPAEYTLYLRRLEAATSAGPG